MVMAVRIRKMAIKKIAVGSVHSIHSRFMVVPPYLDVAKVSEAADPRRPGRSRIRILRALDNPADGGTASQTFPEGKND